METKIILPYKALGTLVGREREFTLFCEQFSGIRHKIINNYRGVLGVRYDVDEIDMIGYYGAVKAFECIVVNKTFGELESVEGLTTLVARNITFYVRYHLSARVTRTSYVTELSLDEPLSPGGDSIATYGEYVYGDEDYGFGCVDTDCFIESLNQRLGTRCEKTLELLRSGYTYQEIGELQGRSKQAVGHDIQKIRQHYTTLISE